MTPLETRLVRSTPEVGEIIETQLNVPGRKYRVLSTFAHAEASHPAFERNARWVCVETI